MPEPFDYTKAVSACKDEACCQDACCNSKQISSGGECRGWSFGKQRYQSKKGCYLLGHKISNFKPANGWVGRLAGKDVPPSNGHVHQLAHTCSKFDGYYNLLVDVDGKVSLDRVEPCRFTDFPEGHHHQKPSGQGWQTVDGCANLTCCREACSAKGGACDSWALSPDGGCQIARGGKLVDDPNWLSCVRPLSSPAASTKLPRVTQLGAAVTELV